VSYLKQFEYAIVIAATESFSRAAEELHIAQPTLSKYIQKLEKSLGIELFDRSTIPIRLTEAGELYVTAGKKVIDSDHQLQKQLQELKDNRNLEINVGISPSRAPYLMPSILQKYQSGGGTGRVVIQEGTIAELEQKLVTGELDLIISVAGDGTASFESVHLFDETILLAVPRRSDNDCTPEEMLLALPHISVGKGQHMWKVMKSVLHAIGCKEPTIECQSIESAMSLVRRGMGAMLVPSYIKDYGSNEQNKTVQFYQMSLDQYPFLESTMNRKVYLFYRREQFLTRAEKNFIRCAEEVARGSTTVQT